MYLLGLLFRVRGEHGVTRGWGISATVGTVCWMFVHFKHYLLSIFRTYCPKFLDGQEFHVTSTTLHRYDNTWCVARLKCVPLTTAWL